MTPYTGSGIPIVNDPKENVLPDVTDCEVCKSPVTYKVSLPLVVCVTVPPNTPKIKS